MGAYGGLEEFSLSLAESLCGSGIAMSVLFKKAGRFAAGSDLRQRIRQSSVSVKFCEKSSWELAKAIRSADVIHLQNPCPDVTFFAKMWQKPLLTQVINHRILGDGVHQRLWWWCLALASRRLYISEFVRSTWDPKHRLADSYVLFPIARLMEGQIPISERRGFAFIGRWIANKGIETLVRAYHAADLNADEWPLRLMGQGPLLDAVRGYVAENNVAGVEILGFVDERKKAEVIRSSRFMVIPPNTREDFGLTAVEARKLGVPCVVTRDGGLPEAAGKFVIQANPGDIDDLRRALCEAAAMSLESYTTLATSSCQSLESELAKPADYIRHYCDLMKLNASNRNRLSTTVRAVVGES